MNKKNSAYKIFIEQISGIFFPVICIITAASLMKSIVVLMSSAGWLDTENGIYRVFYAARDGFFYFLPFFLAVTASRQWKADTFIALLIPSAMLYPDIVKILENGEGFSLFGIGARPAIYHSSVLPVLMSVGLLHFVEKPCDKYLPEVIKGFLKPMICCIVVLPVTFLLFGPLGSFIGDILTSVFFALYDLNPMIAGAFMGAFIQPMVVVGAHWTIVPVCINNIAVNGYDVILPLMAAAVYGQAGAAMAVAFIHKDKVKRSMAASASFIGVVGTTEPCIFGVNLPLVRPFLSGCLAGAIGGAVTGAAGSRCTAFAFPSLTTCIAYVGQGFLVFMASLLGGFVLGFLFTILQKKQIAKKLE